MSSNAIDNQSKAKPAGMQVPILNWRRRKWSFNMLMVNRKILSPCDIFLLKMCPSSHLYKNDYVNRVDARVTGIVVLDLLEIQCH